MGREKLARIITIAVLAGVVGMVAARKWTPAAIVTGRKDPTPQDAIYAMLDAAQQGNVDQYLAQYGGPMAEALKQARADSPDFGKYLRDSSARIKGVAVSEPEMVSPQQVRTRVEFVYQDRNESQVMYLDKSPVGWKISRVDGAELVKTMVPYGTPVR
jgi:hypothetical protein